METIFYCTPADLLSLFQEIERTIPLTYAPRFGNLPRIKAIDSPLRALLPSCHALPAFGQAFRDTPPFDVYTPDDPSLALCAPCLLRFSGPPAVLDDPRVLCEGSWFLSPESRENTPRTLYKAIRRAFTRRFIKSGFCCLSPAVYEKRTDYLFIQRDHSDLAPAWQFGPEDRHVPTDIDTWYRSRGEQRERYQRPPEKLRFFAAAEDLLSLLSNLEADAPLIYTEISRGERGRSYETCFDTAGTWIDANLSAPRNLYLLRPDHRTALHLQIGGLWRASGDIAVFSEAAAIPNVYGDTLYRDFAARIKSCFREISQPRFGPFYLSPRLFSENRDLLLSLCDPYFRLSPAGQLTQLWRKEWEALLARQD
ncbi:MAG: hypothetical protein HFF60_07640 [Oscillospiraceae bacterium]|jgi:hypothetical protein|nr:hypothetical protein [Oscillospiraceae bacterium]